MNEIIINLEGKEYQIDILKAKELGVIKEKDTRCKSWEELRAKYSSGHSYISHDCWQITSHESKSIQTFSKLLNLRRDWIGGWNPDWTDNSQKKFTISYYQGEINLTGGNNVHRVLSFPTEEMRDVFYQNFKNLIEQCKNLI